MPDELKRALREKESLQTELAQLKHELASAVAERDALRRSLSWKITAPLRLVAGILLRATGRFPGTAQPDRLPALPARPLRNLPLGNENYQQLTALYGGLDAHARHAIQTCIEAMRLFRGNVSLSSIK